MTSLPAPLSKPSWLKAKLPTGPTYREVLGIVEAHQLHTVCQSAQCPNMGECWSRGTATFMILGNVCTRSCTFCAVATGRPEAPDFAEPARVAQAIAKMGLRHAVITAVARDDLPDGGAQIWAATVRAVRYRNPQTAIEILIPDFRGNNELLDIVLQASPDILNHNLETVERLQRPVRKTARYQRSLDVLRHAKARGFVTKSGLMLGIGEQDHEVRQALQDLRAAGCDILTLGQYLQPTPRHRAVDRWVTPEAFAQWKAYALELGFGVVESGPLVRSSYHAEEQSGRYTPKGTPAAAGPLPQGAQATPCGPEVHAAAAAG